MVVMTAKIDKKKIAVVLAALLLVVALIALFAGGKRSESTVPETSPAISTNEDRVKFLTDLGWSVTHSPVQTQQVRIPEESSQVYDRYNALQKSQGFDLSQYAGKTVTRYVYAIQNYPDATEPVYATLLVYEGQVIGGDVTSTAPGGKIHGLKMPAASQPESVDE